MNLIGIFFNIIFLLQLYIQYKTSQFNFTCAGAVHMKKSKHTNENKDGAEKARYLSLLQQCLLIFSAQQISS